MSIALPLPDRIHVSSEKTVKHRTLIAQFGDGYSQRAADGINSRVESWTVNWAGLNDTEFSSVIAGLDGAAGHDSITWTPPDSATAKKFILPDGYRVITHCRGLHSVQCQLVQVFEP